MTPIFVLRFHIPLLNDKTTNNQFCTSYLYINTIVIFLMGKTLLWIQEKEIISQRYGWIKQTMMHMFICFTHRFLKFITISPLVWIYSHTSNSFLKRLEDEKTKLFLSFTFFEKYWETDDPENVINLSCIVHFTEESL